MSKIVKAEKKRTEGGKMVEEWVEATLTSSKEQSAITTKL